MPIPAAAPKVRRPRSAPTPPIPAYLNLAAQLRQRVLEGGFPSGHRLPTEAELATELRLSRHTVRQAFAELVMEGLVYRIPGRGTFATQAPNSGAYMRSFGSIDELFSLSEDTEMEIIAPLEEITDLDIARRLLAPSDQVLAMTFRRLHEDHAFSVTKLFLPTEFGPAISREADLLVNGRRSKITIIGLLEKHASITVATASQTITAMPCSTAIATLLDMTAGAPALRIERLYYDVTGKTVQLAINYFNPERYTYRIELRRSRLRRQTAAGGNNAGRGAL